METTSPLTISLGQPLVGMTADVNTTPISKPTRSLPFARTSLLLFTLPKRCGTMCHTSLMAWQISPGWALSLRFKSWCTSYSKMAATKSLTQVALTPVTQCSQLTTPLQISLTGWLQLMALLSLPSGPRPIGPTSCTRTRVQASISTGLIGRSVTGLHTLLSVSSSMPGVTSSVSISPVTLVSLSKPDALMDQSFYTPA